MDENDYKKLCSVCDEILVDNNSSFERVAITWLHVIREHPEFLKHYNSLFLKSSSIISNFYQLILNKIINYGQLFKLILRLLNPLKKKWYGNLPINKPIDYIFVSHLFNSNELIGNNDFYFGKLPTELINEGKSVLLILINHNSIPENEINKNLISSPLSRIVISNTLSFKQEVRIWQDVRKESNVLKFKEKKETSTFKKKIYKYSAIEATSGKTRENIRIATIIGEIVSKCNAYNIITTYEGHSWERLTYFKARLSNPNIFCIGYQHAALFRLSHAAKRLLAPKYNPDRILCAGPVGKRQLKSVKELSSIQMGILGSNRSIKVLPNRENPICLVLPEGLLSECETLFLFSLKCALKCPEIKFVWRVHPVLNKKTIFQNFIKKLGKLPNNIEFSLKTFKEDISRSHWALYRGSTAIISTAANNVIPIYLKKEDQMIIDPLFEIEKIRPVVTTVNQFRGLINKNLFDQKITEYSKNYYSDFNIKDLYL